VLALEPVRAQVQGQGPEPVPVRELVQGWEPVRALVQEPVLVLARELVPHNPWQATRLTVPLTQPELISVFYSFFSSSSNISACLENFLF